MKFLVPIATALIAAIGLTAPAAAAPAQERVVVRERIVTPAASSRVAVRERTTVTRSSNYRSRYKRVCRVRYRNGNRIRTCRNVRRYR